MKRRPPVHAAGDGPGRGPQLGSEDVAALLERLGRRIHGTAFVRGMKPAQWTALRYLARAGDADRTVTAFAAFHATSASSASQTMRRLAGKGLVTTEALRRDSRVKILALTPEARRLLAADPLAGLARAMAGIDGDRLADFVAVVETLLRAL